MSENFLASNQVNALSILKLKQITASICLFSLMATGKNPFALSILKQVEHKLHGQDIDGTRWAIKRKNFSSQFYLFTFLVLLISCYSVKVLEYF